MFPCQSKYLRAEYILLYSFILHFHVDTIFLTVFSYNLSYFSLIAIVLISFKFCHPSQSSLLCISCECPTHFRSPFFYLPPFFNLFYNNSASFNNGCKKDTHSYGRTNKLYIKDISFLHKLKLGQSPIILIQILRYISLNKQIYE